jgi:hypothetical protein
MQSGALIKISFLELTSKVTRKWFLKPFSPGE